MDFVASFVEIIAMLGLLGAIIFGLFYCMRHRTRINRWIENYGAKDNAVEKDTRIRALKSFVSKAHILKHFWNNYMTFDTEGTYYTKPRDGLCLMR